MELGPSFHCRCTPCSNTLTNGRLFCAFFQRKLSVNDDSLNDSTTAPEEKTEKKKKKKKKVNPEEEEQTPADVTLTEEPSAITCEGENGEKKEKKKKKKKDKDRDKSQDEE